MTDTAPQQSEAEAMRAAVREELDEVVPHIVAALKRNDGVADLVRRLDDAERRLAARDQRPLIARLYRLVGLVRRLDLPDEVREMLLDELLDVLRGAGYSEFGAVGEPFRPRPSPSARRGRPRRCRRRGRRLRAWPGNARRGRHPGARSGRRRRARGPHDRGG